MIKLGYTGFTKIWGGNKLRNSFGYKVEDNCGEVWGISGHKSSSSIIMGGEYNGISLRELYKSNKSLFGNHISEEFPILVKLIDAKTDLSIQVHPNDEYARKHHDSFGKTECWYVVDADKGSSIIIGHTANTKDEFQNLIDKNEYDKLLKYTSLNTGDIFDIESGTIHAICSGSVIFEVQQSSDITYRFYDYDRLENGKLRDLHQKEAMDVVSIPSKKITHTGQTEYFNFEITDLKQKEYLSDIYGDYFFVLDGSTIIDNESINKGDFFFIPSKTKYNVNGVLKVAKINIK